MMLRLALCLLPATALADSLVAARTIQARSALTVQDVVMVAADIPGALRSSDEAMGQEARIIIYAGQPILRQSLGAQTAVGRNQLILLRYTRGGLMIETPGRALERGSIDDVIEVLNISSKKKVFGKIIDDGVVNTNVGE
jgi:flagella basal body P-ring formation protein FlgA